MDKNNKNIIALLGPTNTGKTHVAIEKMLNYQSGIFGLPLRLLAEKFTISAFKNWVRKNGFNYRRRKK